MLIGRKLRHAINARVQEALPSDCIICGTHLKSPMDYARHLYNKHKLIECPCKKHPEESGKDIATLNDKLLLFAYHLLLTESPEAHIAMEMMSGTKPRVLIQSYIAQPNERARVLLPAGSWWSHAQWYDIHNPHPYAVEVRIFSDFSHEPSDVFFTVTAT